VLERLTVALSLMTAWTSPSGRDRELAYGTTDKSLDVAGSTGIRVRLRRHLYVQAVLHLSEASRVSRCSTIASIASMSLQRTIGLARGCRTNHETTEMLKQKPRLSGAFL
jgi:hypothetical protein